MTHPAPQPMTLSDVGAQLMTACQNTVALHDPQVPADHPRLAAFGPPEAIRSLRSGRAGQFKLGLELSGILPDSETPDVETLTARLQTTGATVKLVGTELRVSYLPPQLVRPAEASA